MVYPDKRVYEGDWISDKRHGFGTLTYPANKNGDVKQYAGLSIQYKNTKYIKFQKMCTPQRRVFLLDVFPAYFVFRLHHIEH